MGLIWANGSPLRGFKCFLVVWLFRGLLLWKLLFRFWEVNVPPSVCFVLGVYWQTHCYFQLCLYLWSLLRLCWPCIFVYVRLRVFLACVLKSLWHVYRVYLQARLLHSWQGFPKLIPQLQNRKRKRLTVKPKRPL